MPDGEGGNNENVLDNPEVKAAIEAAEKAATAAGYTKGQSDQNKAGQKILDRATAAEEKLAELEQSQFENLSDDDKQKRMIEVLFKERTQRKEPKSEQQDGPASNDDASEAEGAAQKQREKLVEAVKSEGLDPADVDMDNGSAKFIASLLKAKEAKKTKDESDEDEDEDSDPNAGPVDKGGGSPPSKDITKVDPMDLFRKAHSNK